ncbi:hypothetical protein [Rufibacter latericius]|uniref:Lipoprotein n=1 Tax=Rufibacter latericius TaxID=2487040 RepID=A0A3M9MVD3_9BACT|nr:hypothetical protein [Rufibacter latericius]RNI28718.1 hypothetical protein EFB08_08780 [Rufibacter latericius]
MSNRIKLIFLSAIGLLFNSCLEATSTDNKLKTQGSAEELSSSKTYVGNTEKTIDSLAAELQRRDIKFKSLEEASTGESVEIESEKESDSYAYRYRVEIYLSEIYKSVYLTKIEYYGEGGQRIKSTYNIDLEKELHLSGEQTSDLRFVRWVSPFEFEMTVDTRLFTVRIVNSEKVETKEKLPTTTPKKH